MYVFAEKIRKIISELFLLAHLIRSSVNYSPMNMVIKGLPSQPMKLTLLCHRLQINHTDVSPIKKQVVKLCRRSFSKACAKLRLMIATVKPNLRLLSKRFSKQNCFLTRNMQCSSVESEDNSNKTFSIFSVNFIRIVKIVTMSLHKNKNALSKLPFCGALI